MILTFKVLFHLSQIIIGSKRMVNYIIKKCFGSITLISIRKMKIIKTINFENEEFERKKKKNSYVTQWISLKLHIKRLRRLNSIDKMIYLILQNVRDLLTL